jgi:hypothetical protein
MSRRFTTGGAAGPETRNERVQGTTTVTRSTRRRPTRPGFCFNLGSDFRERLVLMHRFPDDRAVTHDLFHRLPGSWCIGLTAKGRFRIGDHSITVGSGGLHGLSDWHQIRFDNRPQISVDYDDRNL